MNLPPRSPRQRAFTLPEMMIVMVILILATAAMIAGHLFGLQLYQIMQAKLGANQQAQKGINRLVADIRQADNVIIGMGDAYSFVPAAESSPQMGNAIQVVELGPPAITSQYYLDTNVDCLMYRSDLNSNTPTIIAQYLTNITTFTGEDYQGNTNTTQRSNQAIDLTLQFYQLLYPTIPLGSNSLFDFYQIHTKVTRRVFQ